MSRSALAALFPISAPGPFRFANYRSDTIAGFIWRSDCRRTRFGKPVSIAGGTTWWDFDEAISAMASSDLADASHSLVEWRVCNDAMKFSTSDLRYRTSRPSRINGTPVPATRSFCSVLRERPVIREISISENSGSTVPRSDAHCET
jgi:hypothetical protein